MLGAHAVDMSRVHAIQLLPLSDCDMTICSPWAGNIARGRSPSAI